MVDCTASSAVSNYTMQINTPVQSVMEKCNAWKRVLLMIFVTLTSAKNVHFSKMIIWDKDYFCILLYIVRSAFQKCSPFFRPTFWSKVPGHRTLIHLISFCSNTFLVSFSR